MLKKVRIFNNDNLESEKISNILKEKLIDEGFIIDNDDFNIAIAIGGDRSFLRMIKKCKYDNKVLYLGLNTGNLGFSQDISKNKIESFIEDLKSNRYYSDKISIGTIKIFTKNKMSKFHFLNEALIRRNGLKVLKADVEVNNSFLEMFSGDGLLISTTYGSTAYNLSLGGSIVSNDIETLQLTPIAPLNNVIYHNLTNSIIFSKKSKIYIFPKNENLFITIDGDNVEFQNVIKIEFSLNNKIQFLRMNDYNYIKKINDKFIDFNKYRN